MVNFDERFFLTTQNTCFIITIGVKYGKRNITCRCK